MPALDQRTVRVEGLRELSRAFRVASRELSRDLRTAIEQAGEPIRADASNLALTRISGMQRSRIPWWRMRTGVYRQTIGYVAPEQRGVKWGGGRRPTVPQEKRRRSNLKDLLLDKAMEPALERNADRVFEEFDDAVGEMTKAWARV